MSAHPKARIRLKPQGLALWCFVIVLSITGLVSYAQLTHVYYRQNLLPASTLFDLFTLIYILSALKTRISPSCLLIALVASGYLFLSIARLPPSQGGAPSISDIILAYKPFIYLIMLCFARPGRGAISIDTLEHVFKFLLVAFLAKYIMAKQVLGIPRPGLFTENNFELPLLLILFVFLSRRGRLHSYAWVVLLLAVVLVSGSRSGLLGLIVALATSARARFNRLAIAVTVVPVVLVVAVTLLGSRIAGLGDLSQVDRFIFLTLFLQEIEQFTFVQYLFGWAPMTPMSDATCGRLSFYSPLFSSGNPLICYPVTLHVFYFRVLLDHGVMGLGLLIFGFYRVLRINGMSTSLAFAVLSQGLVNGLSVSGFANTFFFAAVVLVVLNDTKAAPHRKPTPAHDTIA